jgi:hypothetical protein
VTTTDALTAEPEARGASRTPAETLCGAPCPGHAAGPTQLVVGRGVEARAAHLPNLDRGKLSVRCSLGPVLLPSCFVS